MRELEKPVVMHRPGEWIEVGEKSPHFKKGEDREKNVSVVAHTEIELADYKRAGYVVGRGSVRKAGDEDSAKPID